MITNITTDTATIILPISNIPFPTLDRLNQELGAYVLAEIDYETEGHTKFDIDYSLVEYDDIQDATQEAQQVFEFMLDYLDIRDSLDAKLWAQEQIAYLQDLHKEYVDAWGVDDKLTLEIANELNLALAA
jgi:hypothetical protein